MQTTVKKIQLPGHEFESEVTVRHRTTLGRWELSVPKYPHLTGEGDTEALAIADLATMLSSDPDANEEIAKKNDEAKGKKLQEEKKAREEAKAKSQEVKGAAGGPGELADKPGADLVEGDSGKPGTAHGSDKKPGEAGPKAGGPSSGAADPLHKLEGDMNQPEKNPDGTVKPPPSHGATDEWGHAGGEATPANTDTGKAEGGPSGAAKDDWGVSDGATVSRA